jgi:hypothetical protein
VVSYLEVGSKVKSTLCGIDCFTRHDNGNPDPAELLFRVQTASGSPLKIIKDIERPRGIKRTLKVSIPPWGDLCLSEYRWNPKRIILSPFRLSRGRKAWVFHDDLKRNSVSIPEPVIFLEIKRLMFVTRTYLATRWIDGGFSVHRLALKKDCPLHPPDIESILCACVDVIVNLHKAGFLHGDLKWSNFLYIPAGNPDIVLTDLDSLRKSSFPSAQARDFARFLISSEKYPLGRETIEILIQKYLKEMAFSRAAIEEGIWKYVAARRKDIPKQSCASR